MSDLQDILRGAWVRRSVRTYIAAACPVFTSPQSPEAAVKVALETRLKPMPASRSRVCATANREWLRYYQEQSIFPEGIAPNRTFGVLDRAPGGGRADTWPAVPATKNITQLGRRESTIHYGYRRAKSKLVIAAAKRTAAQY